MALLALTTAGPAAADPGLDAALERATELNVTAPWPESDALLDEIEPRLGQASEPQLARFRLLRTRNLTLAGRFDAAMDAIPELLELEMPAELRLQAISLGANIAMMVRQYETVFEFFNRGLAIEADVDSDIQRSSFLTLASHLHVQVGEMGRARYYADRALNLAEAAADERAQCLAMLRLGYANRTDRTLATAEDNYRDALRLCDAAGDPLMVPIAQFGLAETLRLSGRFDEAVVYFARALEEHERQDYPTGVLETRLRWAELEFARDRTEAAEDLLEDVEDGLEAQDMWDNLADYHHLRSRIERQRGDHRAALAAQDARIRSRENFLDHDRAMRLAFLEVEFESQAKEQELALLREQNRVARLEEESRRQQQRLRQIAYSMAAFLLVVLLLLLVHALRDRRHYRHLSVHDGLTGLLNHTRFFEFGEEKVAQARSENQPLALVLADIDHFKRINDRHGHLVGDEVLRRVSSCIREAVNDHGVIGRIGGEEFAIYLPGHDLEQALDQVRAMRASLADCELPGIEARVSMSFGVAGLEAGESIDSLRARADDALYQAKHKGRDRVEQAAS